MSTTHNHAPQHNHQPHNGNHLRDQDPAADIIDVARDLRASAWETGYHDHEIDEYFEGEGDGARELLDLTDTIRAENRALDPNEQKFVDYMQSKANLNHAQATVDFDAFYAPVNGLDGEAAGKERVKAIIADRQQLAQNTTDDTLRQRLEGQILDLQAFLTIDTYDDTRFAGNFMDAHRQNAQTGSPDTQSNLDDAETALDGHKIDNEVVARAYAVISEDFSRTPDGYTAPDNDPQFAYAAPGAATQPAAQPAAPNQQPTPGTNPNQQPSSADAKKLEKLEAIRAEMEQKELDNIRDRLASSKSRLFKKDNPGIAALEARYNDLITKKAIREYGDVLGDPNVDEDIKRYVATKAVFEEQGRLREATNEKMKNTVPAKMARWVGKHKFLTVAGMTILVPLTGGTAAFGLAAGAGLLAASKADNKLRGLRSTEKSFSQTDLHDLMRKGIDFPTVQEYAMAKYDEDLNRERKKRYVTAGIGASALFATWGLLPPLQGVTHGIQGTGHFLWNHL